MKKVLIFLSLVLAVGTFLFFKSDSVLPVFAASKTFFVDFGNSGAQTSTTGWNNVTDPRVGSAFPLKDSTGAVSPLTVKILDSFYTNSTSPTGSSANTNGTTSSTLYPADATRDSFFLGTLGSVSDTTARIEFGGLDPSATYTLKFYASRMASDTNARVTQYKIGATTVELNATNNTNNAVSIANVSPVNGVIDIDISRKSGSAYAYLGVLEITETSSSSGTINQAPTVAAGNNVTLTLPASSTTLSGTASDPNGDALMYAWSQVSGPSTATIASPSVLSTSVSNLVQGSYVFRLTATDPSGLTGSGDVTVTVQQAMNAVPNVSAGTDQTIISPASDATLLGAASDSDGTITTYAWTKVSGGSATINTPSAASTTVSGLTIGSYVFRLTVTDNNGATAFDDVAVTVNGSGSNLQTLTTISGKNAYVHLPDDYATTGNKTYPLILYIPEYLAATSGVAQDLLNYGPSHFIALGNPMQFTVNNVLEKPIVISLQVGNWPQPETFGPMLNAILSQYRIDQNRVYLTGPSMGAWTADMYVSENTANASKIAAIMAMHAVTIDNPELQMAYFANTGGKWWGIKGADDSWGSPNIPTIMNNAVPGSAKFTIIASGQTGSTHCCWNTFYDPAWTNGGDNVYTWLLKQTHGASQNQVPTANAGSDQSITLPTSSVTLTGSGNDPDGTINAYAWSQVSGPSTATIASPTTATTNIANLAQGTYVFRLIVTDNNGATAFDDVSVAVAPNPNQCSGKTIVVIGSSTAYGTGADPISNSWANKYAAYLTSLGSNQLINLGQPSTTTYVGLPTGTIPPSNRPSPDPAINITKALSYNPSAIIINYPSNDAAAGYSIEEQQANFMAYANAASQAGVPLWVTTTQPRDPLSSSEHQMLITMKDWINSYFGTHAVDFWTTVANSDATINPTYAYGDGVHVNNLGHDLFYNRMLGEGIMESLCGQVPANKAPTANAGSDQSITLPTSSVTLTGSGNDPDGTINAYAWSEQLGPNTATIVNNASASTSISGLIVGTYRFRLTVTDNEGVSAYDDVDVVVNQAVNQTPTVDAGTDQVITLPTNATTLAGTASDTDGTIATYAWAFVSGPATPVIESPSAASTAISNLSSAGVYSFTLTATDNGGASATDTVLVTVNAGSTGTAARVLIDFGGKDYQTTGTWNNLVDPRLNSTLTLKDANNASAGTLTVTDSFFTSSLPTYSANNNGTTASTVYPLNATRDSLFLGTIGSVSDLTAQVKLSNLPAQLYTVQLYASRTASDTTLRTGIYKIGAQSVELNATNNVNNIVSIPNVVPTDGTITIDISRKSGSSYAYLGVLDLIPQ